MARELTYVLSAGMVLLALGCSDHRESSPTSPEFAPSSTACDLSTARGLVNSVFPASARQTANNLLQTIRTAGPGTAASTNAGFDLFALIAASRPVPAEKGSTFINAILPCQRVGSRSLPIDFRGALGPDGAFDVRGGATLDAAVVSHGNQIWGLKPPLNGSTRYTWDQITHQPGGVVTKRFLAYGAPVAVVDSFTNEERVSDVFEWSTVPPLTFGPEVVVGACIIDEGASYLIQHYSKDDNGQIVPSATPSFCPPEGASREGGLSSFRLAQRVFDLFRPQPLFAAALGTRPPGGSIGALSPSAAIDPGPIDLSFENQLVADGRTGQVIRFIGGDFISVSVTPAGKTAMDGVLVRLIATTNLGATVVATGTEAFTEDGTATFPELRINKAGGYRLIATIAGFGRNGNGGFQFSTITSNGFNLKHSK